MQMVTAITASCERRSREPRARARSVDPGFIPSIYTATDVYVTGSVKIWKTSHEISVDIRTFLQCIVSRVSSGVHCVTVRLLQIKREASGGL